LIDGAAVSQAVDKSASITYAEIGVSRRNLLPQRASLTVGSADAAKAICVTTSDGKFVATGNPNSKQLLGVNIKTIRDSNGNPIKLDGATQKPDGEITTTHYNFAKPGTIDKPAGDFQ
jgi:hypothetical protein